MSCHTRPTIYVLKAEAQPARSRARTLSKAELFEVVAREALVDAPGRRWNTAVVSDQVRLSLRTLASGGTLTSLLKMLVAAAASSNSTSCLSQLTTSYRCRESLTY